MLTSDSMKKYNYACCQCIPTLNILGQLYINSLVPRPSYFAHAKYESLGTRALHSAMTVVLLYVLCAIVL